jgi:hypothetical protein
MLVLFYVEELYVDPVIHKQVVGGWKTLAISISAAGEFRGGYLIGNGHYMLLRLVLPSAITNYLWEFGMWKIPINLCDI